MNGVYNYEIIKEKIERSFNIVLMKKDDKEFPNYIASLFDNLLSDINIDAILSQIINEKINLEDEFKDYCNDIYKIYNNYLILFRRILRKSKKLKQYIEIEDPDSYIIPLSLELNNRPMVSDAKYLISAFKSFKAFIEKHKLCSVLERVYLWNRATEEVRNHRIFIEQMLAINIDIGNEAEVKPSWRFLCSSIWRIETYDSQLDFLRQTSVRQYLLEILSFIKQYHTFYPRLKSFYLNNPIVEDYRQENRNDIVLNITDKSDWQYKLLRIKAALIEKLDSNWNLDFTLKQYCTKIEQFNVKKIQKLIHQYGSSKLENTLQLNLAEYLFDRGLNPIIEKQFYKDRSDILTTTKEEQVVEVKVFRDLASIQDIFQGFVQTYKYMTQHNTNNGYYVIYSACNTHKINSIPLFFSNYKNIYIYVIDISNFSGRTDKREEVNITHIDIKEFMSNKEVYVGKPFNEASLVDFLRIKGLGGERAYKLFKSKNIISCSADLLKIHGVAKGIKKRIESIFTF